MTFPEFENLQRQLFAEIENIGATKGKEYASSEDKLANFKRLSVELEIKPEYVAWIYFKKHLDSINNYLKIGKELSEEGIRGRFLDAINYLILMYALIYEKSSVNVNSIGGLNQVVDNLNYLIKSWLKENPFFNQLYFDTFRGEIPTICHFCNNYIYKNQSYARGNILFAHYTCLGSLHLYKNETKTTEEIKTEDRASNTKNIRET